MALWKKIAIIILIVAVIVGGVKAITLFKGNETKTNASVNKNASVGELIREIYSEVPEEDMPMMLEVFGIYEENIKDFIGTADVEFEEAIASEPAVTSIAHSVVLLKSKDEAAAKKLVKQIEENVDPRKWKCVEAEKVIVKNNGNLVALIMSFNDTAEQIEKAFDNF